MAQVYRIAPEGFNPTASVAACYLEHDGKVLLLRSSSLKTQSGKWGVPAGRLEQDETPLEAAERELEEETGIKLDGMESLGCLYIRRPEIDFIFHMFRFALREKPDVRLNPENDAFHWAAVHEFETLPLMLGGRSAFRHYFQARSKAEKRPIASVSSYLILEKGNEILLGLRQNTGYSDGLWSLPAGHVEESESASSAMVREAKEELGIDIDVHDLKPIHIMHRQSNRINIDIFFRCGKWSGAIENKEPEKCEKLSFFSQDALPENLVGYNRQVLEGKGFYSEPGWE